MACVTCDARKDHLTQSAQGAQRKDKSILLCVPCDPCERKLPPVGGVADPTPVDSSSLVGRPTAAAADRQGTRRTRRASAAGAPVRGDRAPGRPPALRVADRKVFDSRITDNDFGREIFRLFHHSSIPPFRPLVTPLLQYSITPAVWRNLGSPSGRRAGRPYGAWSETVFTISTTLTILTRRDSCYPLDQ